MFTPVRSKPSVGWQHGPVHIVIEGHDLPGRTFCDEHGSPIGNVQVGVQVRKEPEGLVPGDASSARWDVEVDVVAGKDGERDFRGPAVHGKRGDRFLYLTWGNVTDTGTFTMFRRAKLMLDRIDADLVHHAAVEHQPLIARVRLSDDLGTPRCARVDPPDLTWRL